ncbi:MAG TPA: alpha/beta hydrolase [Micromonosporaceae bacterium]|jgi:hypothetical protein
MVGYAELWRADPEAWRAAAAAWRILSAGLGRRGAEVTLVAAGLRGQWSGPAGSAADRRLAAVSEPCGAAAADCLATDQVLAEFAVRLSRAKATLAAAVARPVHPLVRVDERGRVTVAAPGGRPDPEAFAAARRTADGIRAALDLAGAADEEAVRRLADLTAAAAAGWPMERPPGSPACGAEPVAVRAWWGALTDAQRRWLVVRTPALVGRLDGVPAAARDRANRALLAAAPGPATARLSERLAADGRPRAYLLGLDVAGDGRAIVAVGDPDLADHVLSYVPGAGTGLADLPGELGRVDRMLERAAVLAPDRSVAGVLWLDYDAPDLINDALRASYAQDGGPALHRFQEGLRASHDGPAHLTVVAHSYGSLVVGVTARDHGLAADDVVFLGSPGVGVRHAAELGLPTDRVWSSTAANDPIQRLAPSLVQAAREVAFAALVPTAAPWLLARPDADLWHGHNPSDPSFGGRVFFSDPSDPLHGHSDYWRYGNPALDTVARIALGLA